MIKIRLEYPYDNRPPKYKKGWIASNEPFFLMCALWEYNNKPGKLNIEKVSIPSVIPGYDIVDFIEKSARHNEHFVKPEVVIR